ncbi:MAG TPA: family 10 glycosylhydrolase [Thermoclostridium sp.]|nr:family 10 glycosylhydrolase [Thermoclostridium sp.]
MKSIARVLIVFILILSLTIPVFAADAPISGRSARTDFRGLWVSTVANIDYPVKPTTDPATLKSEAIRILDFAQDTGFNAVFLQVRPTADAFYKSGIFPWSKYLTGKQGTAPDGGFDPLKFWVEEAHKRGLELHAWINPYRVTKKGASEPSHNFAALASSNPAVKNPQWVVKHSDGNLYFDPGLPEVRKLIIDGVLEIVRNYDVDGIHFDDYFYPSTSFNDQATYNKYKAPGQSLDDWRRENVNTLIRDCYKAIKQVRSSVRFGISPFGIWANRSSNPKGSDTNGFQSYSGHYADSLKWVKDGIIDYIAPQLYWNIGYSIADYSKLLTWWSNAVSGTGVDLYIGHAAYKAGDSDPNSPWHGAGEIVRQLELNDTMERVSGSIMFTYNSLANYPELAAAIKEVFSRRDQTAGRYKLSVSRPSSNITTSLEKYYINGASDPDKPLYVNGIIVPDRSEQGFFGFLVSLQPGENKFTFTQGGTTVTRVITRTVPAVAEKMSKAEIISASTFPRSQFYGMPGETITLSCQAPAGSKVTVKIDGKTYNMSQATSAPSADGLYAATFTCRYTLPAYTGTPRIVDLGVPVYTMSYKGTVNTKNGGARIGVIMKGAPYYAEVKVPMTYTFNEPSSTNGGIHQLYSGMMDSITGMSGSYVRLSSGQWVEKGDVNIYTPDFSIEPVIRNMEYRTTDAWHVLKLDTTITPAAFAEFDGTSIKLTVSASSTASRPQLPADALISSVDISKNSNSGTQITLTLKPGVTLGGHYIEKTGTGLELRIRRKATVKNQGLPLSGITIMLDPGHGGTDPGAIGPLGWVYAEKDINLNLSRKLKQELETLGAKVYLTREIDTFISLEDRLSMSRLMLPDLFVSLHSNSMPDDVDISKVDGFSVWYREKLAAQLAGLLYDHVTGSLNRTQKGTHVRNFYVTRGTWTPSILLETGFVPNPGEFEWLTDEAEQTRLAKSIAEAITEYFRN